MIRIPNIEQKTHIFNLPRRRIRYWLYRFKNEEQGGALSNGSPDGLRDHFERLPGFDGWEQFAVSWDIPHLSNCVKSVTQFGVCSCSRQVVPLKIVLRDRSVADEWRQVIMREAPILKIRGRQNKNQAKSISKGF